MSDKYIEAKVIDQENIKPTVKISEIFISTVIVLVTVIFAYELIDYILTGCSNSKFDYLLLMIALTSAGISIYNMLINIKDYIKSKIDTKQSL